MAIIRGHNYQTDSVVTAANLHALVDNARITGLGLSDISSNARGLFTSTPSSLYAGSLLFLHETTASLGRPAANLGLWTNPTYMVYHFGRWITLFGADRMESGRFFLSADYSGSRIRRGDAALYEQTISGAGGVTLQIGLNAGTVAKTFTMGSPRATTNYAAAGAQLRLQLIGPAEGLFSANTRGSPWWDVLYHANASTNWDRSTATWPSGFHAYRLTTWNAAPDSGLFLQPMYLMGAMNFRV